MAVTLHRPRAHGIYRSLHGLHRLGRLRLHRHGAVVVLLLVQRQLLLAGRADEGQRHLFASRCPSAVL